MLKEQFLRFGNVLRGGPPEDKQLLRYRSREIGAPSIFADPSDNERYAGAYQAASRLGAPGVAGALGFNLLRELSQGVGFAIGGGPFLAPGWLASPPQTEEEEDAGQGMNLRSLETVLNAIKNANRKRYGLPIIQAGW